MKLLLEVGLCESFIEEANAGVNEDDKIVKEVVREGFAVAFKPLLLTHEEFRAFVASLKGSALEVVTKE